MIKKYSIDDFNLLTVLGKGLYGKVFLVRELESQQVFALKVMKKSIIERKHKEQFVFSERNMLVEVAIPLTAAASPLHHTSARHLPKRKKILLHLGVLSRRRALLAAHPQGEVHGGAVNRWLKQG